MTVGIKSSPQQIIAAVLDTTNQSIKTTMVNTEIAIELSAADGDNVRVWNGEEPLDWDCYSNVLSGVDTIVTTTYRSGGLAGTIKGTVVRTYSTNARTFLVSLVRT